jgi:hypothetical protein
MRIHWTSVEVLTNALLRQNTLSKYNMYLIIENDLTEKQKQKLWVLQDWKSK